MSRSFRGFPKHNPFYLLSAACMLTGCLMLSNTTTWSPIALRRLLTLLITVNFYELSLLALAASNDPLAVWASLDHRLMGLRHDVGS